MAIAGFENPLCVIVSADIFELRDAVRFGYWVGLRVGPGVKLAMVDAIFSGFAGELKSGCTFGSFRANF